MSAKEGKKAMGRPRGEWEWSHRGAVGSGGQIYYWCRFDNHILHTCQQGNRLRPLRMVCSAAAQSGRGRRANLGTFM